MIVILCLSSDRLLQEADGQGVVEHGLLELLVGLVAHLEELGHVVLGVRDVL